MSNIEMVSVPRELAERIKKTCMFAMFEADYEELRMTLGKPAEQHQGEPVMKLEAEKLWGGDGEYVVSFVKPGWLQECRTKGGTFLLFTHADPCEAERLREQVSAYKASRERLHEWIREEQLKNIALRAKLDERDALLRETDEFMYIMTGHDSHARLVHRYGENWWDAIDKLRGKANGVLSASAVPSAPVEQDERADFERTFKKRYPNAVHTFELERGPKGQYLVQPAKTEWDGWQARAALARKP